MKSPSYFKIIAKTFDNRPLAVFDRDGTLTFDEKGYTHKISDYVLLPDVRSTLQKLTDLAVNISIATNQSGVGRGFFSEKDFIEFTDLLLSDLSDSGIRIQAVVACFHTPQENCPCRKPNPLLLQALKNSLSHNGRIAYFGDKQTDLAAAENAEIEGYLIKSGDIKNSVAKWLESIDDL